MTIEAMPQRDTIDFLTAFAIGAIAGAAATLLLRPGPATRRARIARELRPYRRRLRTSARRARKEFGSAAAAAGEVGGTLREASRELIQEFRNEMSDIIATAREDLARTVSHQITQAERALRRQQRRLGRV